VNYYELLNIARDADGAAVKRAYFSAVKLHSPDSDPEGFKAIRTAYETLSSPKQRAEYDSWFTATDAGIQNDLLAARKLIQDNRYKQAVEFLTGLCAKNPDSAEIKRLLAETLWLMNKNGAAEKICAELLKKNPADCDTLLLRANIADSNGHTKKAGGYYNDAVTVAPLNSNAWVKYIHYVLLHEPRRILNIFERAMEKSQDMFLDEYIIYLLGARELELSSGKSLFPPENPLKYYNKFAELFVNDKNPHETIYDIAMKVIPGIARKNEIVPFLQKVLPALENSKHRKDEDEEDIKFIREVIVLDKLRSDKRIHDIFTDLTAFLMDGNSDNYSKSVMECYIVSRLPALRPSIKALRDEYPECFKLNQAFYIDALNEKKADFLADKYYAVHKKLESVMPDEPDDEEFDEEFYDDFDDFIETEEVTTFVREAPKTGRNDPCPCGSGKKYKKCCG
jgi:curved DNA-binding protein CbpA